jgi:replicative DNA helicase
MDGNKAYNAEIAVLGALLIHNDLLDEVIHDVRPEDFHDYFHKNVYTAIIEMKHEGMAFDLVTMSATKYKLLGETENNAFCKLAELANSSYTAANIKHYAEIVKKESNKRKTAALLAHVNQKILNGDEDYLEYVRKGLIEIENNQPCIITPYTSILDETLVQLENDSKNPDAMTGLSTGFIDLDFYTNGLQKSNMIILAARPSMGKTALMLNIADHISIKQNLPIAIFSLEQPKRDLCKRSLARIAQVNGDNIFKARFKENDWEKISMAIGIMNQAKTFINDSGSTTIYEIRAYCRKVRNQHGLSAVFIDYIGQIQGGNAENETLRLGYISRELKILAKDFDIPVFVLCQLNRRIESRQDRRPMLSDIRQSGNIEQDADVIIFLESKDHESTLFIEKNRNGRTGEVKLVSKPEFFEFKNSTKF